MRAPSKIKKLISELDELAYYLEEDCGHTRNSVQAIYDAMEELENVENNLKKWDRRQNVRN